MIVEWWDAGTEHHRSVSMSNLEESIALQAEFPLLHLHYLLLRHPFKVYLASGSFSFSFAPLIYSLRAATLPFAHAWSSLL